MRILTYANPFELKNEPELWKLISSHPHFCASDTLVQGLSRCYGRAAFKTLRPIQDLLDVFYKEYTKNPVNDMQLFLTVSNAIRQWEDGAVKQAFLFNKAEVVKAIQLLLPLECDVAEFDRPALPEEQRRFLDLMQTAVESPCYKNFEACRRKSEKDYHEAIGQVNVKEIKYDLKILNRDLRLELSSLGLNLSFEEQDVAAAGAVAGKVLAYLEEKRKNDWWFPPVSQAEKSLQVASRLLSDQNDDYYKTVVFHGIHQITPMMFFLFHHLEQLGMQVVFLINYADNLPKLYETWKNVYSWCDTRFEFVSPIDLTQGNALGRSIATVIEGKPVEVIEDKVIEYATMTSFATSEAGRNYAETIGHEGLGNLAKMSKQYYAVQGRSSNEILQMYYPEQFREKPFLSYPIGQFILGLYKMWDFEERRLRINPTSLSECVVSGIFQPGNKLLDTIRKTKLLFSDIDSCPDYIKRICGLEEIRLKLKSRRLSDWDLLRPVSFFGLDDQDLEDLRNYLYRLQKLAGHLFNGMSEHVDYLEHFKDLIELISDPEFSGGYVSNSERELIREITDRLSSPTAETVVGNTMDLKDALAFFLSGRLDSDSSNWIVRDFMQIDGAVLLSKSTNADTYHFALLSNEHMTKSNNNDLPWPLTIEMFGQYSKYKEAVTAVTVGQREKRNFLRYILFYGVFFSQKKIELSYVKEENGEKQSQYYLLSAIGMGKKKFEDPFEYRFVPRGITESQLIDPEPLSDEEKELFSVCPFKYLFNRIIKTPIEYNSEYHIKYYLSFALAFVVWKRTHGEQKLVNSEMDRSISELKKLFPFWGESVFADIKTQAGSGLRDAMTRSNPFSYWYIRRKRNFLVAKWKNQETGEEYCFLDPDVEEQWEKYMQSCQIYPLPNDLPPAGICNDCSFSEFCLREFYDAHGDTEEG